MNRSLEAWRRDCLASQARAEHLRQRRRNAEWDRRVAAIVIVWLSLLIAAWWLL